MNLFWAELTFAESAEFLEKQQILVSVAAATRDAHMCSRPQASSSSCCGLGSRRSFSSRSDKTHRSPQIYLPSAAARCTERRPPGGGSRGATAGRVKS